MSVMARNVIPRGCTLTSVKKLTAGGYLVGYRCPGNLGERHKKVSAITRAFAGYSKQNRRSRRTRRSAKRR